MIVGLSSGELTARLRTGWALRACPARWPSLPIGRPFPRAALREQHLAAQHRRGHAVVTFAEEQRA